MLAIALGQALSAMVRKPMLWIAGIFLGLFSLANLVIEVSGGSFLAGRLWIIGIIIFPLFLAGLLYLIRDDNAGFSSFFREGAKRYFRVLLPTLIIVFAALLTIGVIIASLFLIGISAGSGVLIIPLFGVIVPFIFFTLFYDTVAVWEDTRAFESIRRSVELVLTNPAPVIGFCIVSLVVCGGIGVVILMIWTGLLYDRLAPVASWNTTQIQQITPEYLVTMLGPEGIWISGILLAAGIIILTTFFYTFKGYMYRQLVSASPLTGHIGGEYDEKGRWYKY